MSAFAELAVTTNFSFLRCALHPQEMVRRAEVDLRERLRGHPRLAGIAVEVVVDALGPGRREGRAGDPARGRPADVRELAGGPHPADLARQQAEAADAGRLLARLEEHLQADADAE